MSLEKFNFENINNKELKENLSVEEKIKAEIEKEVSAGNFNKEEVEMLKENLKEQNKKISENDLNEIALDIWKQIEVEKRLGKSE